MICKGKYKRIRGKEASISSDLGETLSISIYTYMYTHRQKKLKSKLVKC